MVPFTMFRILPGIHLGTIALPYVYISYMHKYRYEYIHIISYDYSTHTYIPTGLVVGIVSMYRHMHGVSETRRNLKFLMYRGGGACVFPVDSCVMRQQTAAAEIGEDELRTSMTRRHHPYTQKQKTKNQTTTACSHKINSLCSFQ